MRPEHHDWGRLQLLCTGFRRDSVEAVSFYAGTEGMARPESLTQRWSSLFRQKPPSPGDSLTKSWAGLCCDSDEGRGGADRTQTRNPDCVDGLSSIHRQP